MNITLHDYQKKAVESRKTGLLHFTLGALEENSDGCGLAILKAITGSGKTVIAAHYINSLLKHPERPETDICVFWISKGNGDLHIQSGNRLAELLNEGIAVKLIENASDFIGQLPRPKGRSLRKAHC